MKHLMIGRSLVGVALLAAAYVASQPTTAQSPKAAPADSADLAKRPTPHLPDGRPDLNGTYFHDGGVSFIKPQKLADGSVCIFGCAPPPPANSGGGKADAGAGGQQSGAPPGVTLPEPEPFPKYKPEFQAKVKDLSDRQVQTDTVLQCHPPGVPRIGPPGKIVQTSREMLFLYDDVNGSFFRIIPIDGRPRRKDLPPSFLGDAIGRWDGDTLVVETVNFNDETWLIDNGAFHTKDLRVVERLRRIGDTIEYQAVAHDPSVLVEPWTMRPRTLTLTNRELEESARCEDRDLELIIDGS